ncbi:MAG: NUMOD3 domain-containing DNA-binding protein [Candidatus Aenigmatarchaeota archaeon]
MPRGVYLRNEKHLKLLEVARSEIKVPPFLGKHHSDETKLKISQRLKGSQVWNKGKKLPYDVWNKGMTKETNKKLKIIGQKISISNKGRKVWNKGKENKELKQRWQNPEFRKIMIEISKDIMKKNWNNPVYIEKMEKLRTFFKRKRNVQEIERLRNISNNRLGSKNSVEQNKKISEARLRQKIPHKDTYPEMLVQKCLAERNINFTTHYSILGQPDIFIKPNICVFIDGCYWHGCPVHFPEKINTNDIKISEALRKQGYTVIRIWEHEIKNNTTKCINKIMESIENGQDISR